ncbi:MAG: putative manganese-dependent inorganic diphosphatase [Lachnospiraceae bacterium]|jgi:manganese-dependent inorganic pyrophosphatase|nr:putative manganese-dependent inorganic diphosphatase [Lachnospiraceae bacterium]
MVNKEKKPVWVIGHKNPDTDSICAAISYAYFKSQLGDGQTYIPKKAGKLNGESRYVLDRFSVPEPETVTDVSTQIKDLSFRRNAGIDSHYSLKKAWSLMRRLDVVTMPVVTRDGFLEGIISNSDIAYSYMDVIDNRILSRARTQYLNILETLNGTILSGNDHAYFIKGKVVMAAGSEERVRQDIQADDLVIVGNIHDRIQTVLEQNPSCVVITGSGKENVDPDVILMAGAIQCVLIVTEFDSFTTARLINQSMPIRSVMTKDHFISFDLDDRVDDVQEQMSKVRHRDFPVLDQQHRYIGMVSRRNLLDAQKKKIILVDHNEKSQAVDGIEEAEILEIIDHHRLGSLETMQPIYFRNQPLGCTNTIIYHMFREKEIPIPQKIAGIMLSAILSDTLMFRSPTCTPMDEAAARALAEIADVDIEELAVAMFEAGSDFTGKTPDQIVYTDFKIFYSGDVSFGVSQVSAPTTRQLDSIRDGLSSYLKTVQADKNLDMVFVMLTNILEENSELLYAGNDAERIIQSAFSDQLENKDGRIYLPGVVSRKKQMVPPIIEAIQREE